MGVEFDWTVKLGDLLTLASFIVGGLLFMLKIRDDVHSIKATESRNAQRLADMEKAFEEIARTTTTLAVQDVRLKSCERRLDDIEDDVRLLMRPHV